MRKSIWLIWLVAVALLIGCGKGDRETSGPQYHKKDRAKSKTIATVGQSEIKLFILDEYNRMYSIDYKDADDEYKTKKAYLDSLINMYVLVEAAYDQKLDKDPEIIQILADSRPDFLRDELFKLKILPNIGVTDEDAQKWYDRMGQEARISIIYVLDSTRADSIYNAVRKGADFAALARQHSEDKATAVQGGDLGFRAYASLSEDFQNQVFELKPGEFAIVKVPVGWNIATVTERREVPRDPFKDVRDAIKSRIQAIKRTRVQGAFYDELIKKANVKINTETSDFILDKVETLYPAVIGGVPFRKNTFNPDDLAQYEKNMILATYQGGEVTLGDYLASTASWEDKDRPPFSDTLGLKEAIFKLRLLDLLKAEAESLRLDETDDFRDVTRFFKDQIMAAKMSEVVAKEKSFVSDQEIATYYDAHPEEYTIPRKLQVQEINVNTEVEADRIYERLSKGEDFGALAEKFTIRPAMKAKKGDLGLIADFNFPTLYEQAGKLKLNAYSKPFPVGDQWSIVKLLAVQEGSRMPLEKVSQQIKTKLENEKRTKAVEQWTTEIRKKYPIKVDYDMIWETIDKSVYEKK